MILPVPVGRSFTYAVPPQMAECIKVGCRVVVPFGNNKLHTGIVLAESDGSGTGNYEIKEILELVDTEPVVGEHELRMWGWMADYYMCTLGDVMKAALPSGMKLASETSIRLKEDFDSFDSLTKTELAVMDKLAVGRHKTLEELHKAAKDINVLRVVRSLMQKGALEISETMVETFRAKKEVHVRLSSKLLDETALNNLFDSLQKTPRRYSLVLKLVEMASVETAIS